MIADSFISLHVHGHSDVVLEVDGDTSFTAMSDKVLGFRVVRTIRDAYA